MRRAAALAVRVAASTAASTSGLSTCAAAPGLAAAAGRARAGWMVARGPPAWRPPCAALLHTTSCGRDGDSGVSAAPRPPTDLVAEAKAVLEVSDVCLCGGLGV